MRRPKRAAALALPVSASLLLAGCTGGSGDGDQSGGEAPGGSFSVSLAEPDPLAPTSACYSSACSQVINMVWTALLQIDPETSEQQLRMAQSIETEDSKTWTIKLKDGFTFHNGEPVDAASYVRAWNYAAYAPNATEVGFFFDDVQGYDDLQGKDPQAKEMSGLKAVDEQTIEVKLTQPFSQFPLLLSYTPAAAPMAEECMQDIKACNEMPIGNGPYEFAEKWQHNTSITLSKYEDYSDEETSGIADEIRFKIYSDPKTAFRDFQSGNLDIMDGVDPSQQLQAEGQYPDKILKADTGSLQYFGFPHYDEAYQDKRVRQALSLAIDRETIIERVLNGLYDPATDVIPGFVPGSRDDACEFCAYDPERAKDLLEKAGGIPGNTVNIWFNNDGGHEQWVTAMGQGWKQDLGLDFKIRSLPFNAYLNTLNTRSKVDGPFRLTWLPDYPSPENYLDPVYGAGSSNYGKWDGPRRDEFLTKVAEGNAASTVDGGVPAYQEAADIVLDEMAVIPLWFGRTFIVSSDRVDNVAFSPLEELLLKDVTVSG